MQLTQHFSLEEMCHSEIGERRKIPNIPPHEVVLELTRLCETVLERLRHEAGKPVIVNSGYRSPLLNRVIGGSRTSDHMFGRAADIRIPGITPLNVCKLVSMLKLPFKQCIYEGTWCHVSIPIRGTYPRRELLTAVFGRNGATYIPGFVEK